MQVSVATLRAVTTWHCHTDKLVEILINPLTYEDHMMETQKGGGSGNKMALSYGKQGRLTANKNIAGT